MSLRSFLKRNETKLVNYPCSVEYEVANHIRNVCDKGGPILILNDPNFPDYSIVGGVYATKERVMGIFQNISDNNSLECVNLFSYLNRVAEFGTHSDTYTRVHPDRSEVMKNIINGEDVDLGKLPICTHNVKDGGKFITAGVNVVKWVDNITHGLGIHRMKVIDRNHLSCLAPPNRRIGFPYYQASKKNKSIRMAVIIGAPPEVVLASQSKIPPTCEKYNVAAGITGESVKVVYLEDSELLVPADAELVLECESIPNSFHDDTPFLEYPGVYSCRTNAWVVKVNRIYHRDNCLYQTILTGKLPQEDSNLCAIPYAADVYGIASKYVEEVTDISVFLGNCVFDTVIAVKKESNEQIQNLMYALLGNKYLKSITVIDHDLDANNVEDVRFAMNTRMQPNRDIIITNLALGASLDPSSPLFQSTSKMAIDATIPIGKTAEETAYNKFRHSRGDTKGGRIDRSKWVDVTLK